MKAIVSVFARDAKGISAYITAALAEQNINILDISQTLKQGYITMIMLVDLARNDLSRVCEPDSVEVVSLMDVLRYSHIMHICSTVTGRVLPGLSVMDVFTSAFPAGTLSGAPKPKAIELIDQMEPADRGIYGGTVGYFDFSGNMDMAIAIRTAFIRDHKASVQAGAGLVLDSIPENEWMETRNKASASVEAIKIAAQLKQV